jgi:hypothetical protein
MIIVANARICIGSAYIVTSYSLDTNHFRLTAFEFSSSCFSKDRVIRSTALQILTSSTALGAFHSHLTASLIETHTIKYSGIRRTAQKKDSALEKRT